MRLRRAAGFAMTRGGLGRALAIAAALYLALVQMLSAAHAYSGDASAPDHNSTACVFCLNGHQTDDALPAVDETPSLAAPMPAAPGLPLETPRLAGAETTTGPPTRAPPSA